MNLFYFYFFFPLRNFYDVNFKTQLKYVKRKKINKSFETFLQNLNNYLIIRYSSPVLAQNNSNWLINELDFKWMLYILRKLLREIAENKEKSQSYSISMLEVGQKSLIVESLLNRLLKSSLFLLCSHKKMCAFFMYET